MSDKREHAGSQRRVSDEEIDLAARSLVAAYPSARLSANVLRRLHAAGAGQAGFVPAERLRRWQVAFALLAVLFVGVVGLMQLSQTPSPAPRIADSIKPPATGPHPPEVAEPAVPATATPRPLSPRRSRVTPREAPEQDVPPSRTLRRLVGPRLAERVGRSTIEPSFAWDRMAPSQSEQSTVAPVPDPPFGVAPLELPPLPVPTPVVIPPIIIPELTLK